MHHSGPPPPPPPHGGYPPQHQRSGYGPPPPHSGRGTKRTHTDREESGFGGRHDYHTHWGTGYEDQHRPKRKWSGEEREKDKQLDERPRILIKHDEKRTVGRACSPEKKPESPSEGGEKSSVSSFHRTLSSSSDPPGSSGEATRHRVTFADDVMETAGDKDEANVQVPQGSSRRAPMQKIMLRKMGDKDSDPAAEKGKETGPTGPGGSGRGVPKMGDQDAMAAESAKPKAAWSSNERGPISSSKTLYEPEGKQSVAKFKKYHAQTREMPPGSRGSHDLATPTSEGGTTPTGDRPDGGNRRDGTSSPIDRTGQSSPSGKERRPSDYRKGGRKGEREKPPFQDQDTHDHHNRPHHRKENSRRERGGEGEHSEVAPPLSPAAAKMRPVAMERLPSKEDEEGGRDENEHHHYEPRGKGHRREPPHHQDRPPLLGTA